MKVLITGGCGFIGTHLAKRLHKEGLNVYIVDKLFISSKKAINKDFNFYNIDTSSDKCDELFKNNNFDAVVDLAFDSKNPEASISGTVNMLELSRKYGVKKFIYGSSKEVYGHSTVLPLKEGGATEPVTPLGISKYTVEYYCKKWHDIYGLDTLCFRFSNVYGPGDKVGLVSGFINKALKNQDIVINGDGEQTRDFIYVEDLVDGIYRALNCSYFGVLNLSSKVEHSIKNLAENIITFKQVNITFTEAVPGGLKRSSLDNSKAIEILGWKPKYSFIEGLERTWKWYEKEALKDTAEKSFEKLQEKVEKLVSKRILPYLENLIIFVFIAFLTLVVLKDRYSILTSPFDFCYIYILVMAVIYGMRQALISIILSSGLYIYFALSNGVNIISIIYEPTNLLHICIYIIFGAFAGYAVDVNKNKLYMNDLKLENLNEKYNFLEYIYNETSSVKEKLENQIKNSEDSFVSMYNATKSLESFRVDEIYQRAIQILERLLKTTKVSIYTASKDGNFLRLKAKSVSYNFNTPYSLNLSRDYSEVKEAILRDGIYVNKKMNPNNPILAAPVIDGNKIVGYIAIRDLSFETLTLYYINLFKVLVELISSSITKAYRYDQATAKDKYYAETEIFLNEEFNSILKDKIASKKTAGIDFTIIKIHEDNYSIKEVYARVSQVIRESDVLGLGKDSAIYCILSNSDQISSQKVLGRLENTGVRAQIVEEVIENV